MEVLVCSDSELNFGDFGETWRRNTITTNEKGKGGEYRTVSYEIQSSSPSVDTYGQIHTSWANSVHYMDKMITKAHGNIAGPALMVMLRSKLVGDI